MTATRGSAPILTALDDPTRALVRLAAVVTVGSEAETRAALAGVVGAVPERWVEELILQTYLFAGFPRSLNAMREWRKASGTTASEHDERHEPAWRAEGERTCAEVYGPTYERLRVNIQHLHPALDDWMIVEGYGKVLSRDGLDLPRRELCIVAACAAAGQDRQLHSHLHGALNVGVAPAVVDDALGALEGIVAIERLTPARMLWARVRGK